MQVSMRVYFLILNFLFLIAICKAQTENTLLDPKLLPSTESKIFLLLVNQDSIIVGPSTFIYNPRLQVSDSNDLFLVDFGVNYDINNLKYFNYKKRLFILFFITESDSNYAVLCSVNYKKLMKGKKDEKIERTLKKFTMNCCYDLIDYTLNKNVLNLRFKNNSFAIDLDKDLKTLNYLMFKYDRKEEKKDKKTFNELFRKENREFESKRRKAR